MTAPASPVRARRRPTGRGAARAGARRAPAGAEPPAPAEWLARPVTVLAGVGTSRAAEFARVGLHTVEDVLCRFPVRYEDRSRFLPIDEARSGSTVTLRGDLLDPRVVATRRPGYRVCRARLRDESGGIDLIWPNQAYLVSALGARGPVVVHGVVRTWSGRRQIVNPEVERLDPDGSASIHTGRIVPVYERIGSMTTRRQRVMMSALVAALPVEVPEPLPRALLERHGWPDRREAWRRVHFPPTGESLEVLNRFRTSSHVRLIAEEFFCFQIGLALARRIARAAEKPHAIVIDEQVRAAARRVLPFRLTPGQRRALQEIVADLQAPVPMNRLLQGDVGSGKTIVALLAAVVVLANARQVAVMVPTELLAEQQAATMRGALAAAGPWPVDLLTAATPPGERRRLLAALDAGEPRLVVGTHALAQESVRFTSLGLAVIDEQHRFGVRQRATLRTKGGRPDVLVMTATPIPRSLALTLYGDLDLSVIRDLPPGRVPVETTAMPDGDRAAVYQAAAREIDRGRQVYVVFPLVDDSPSAGLRAAASMADHLATSVLPSCRVGLVHGRMPAESREAAMRRFARGEIDLLVATSVIEVGIDVANASMIIVEHAERFGLAQLHQLRGRVGRGSHPSRCVLLYGRPLTDEARARLDALVATSDGFVIAERDLALRGPGDLSGVRQAGLPPWRVGDLTRDGALMALARREAVSWVAGGGVPAEATSSALAAWSGRFGLSAVG